MQGCEVTNELMGWFQRRLWRETLQWIWEKSEICGRMLVDETSAADLVRTGVREFGIGGG